MNEVGPEHSLDFRKEILTPLFARIQSAESCAVIGAASIGKNRLQNHLLRPDVQQHYLGEQAAQTLFVQVDCNRMYEPNQWGLYELLLMTLAEACGQQSEAGLLRPQINGLQAQVISSRDALMGLRFFELITLQLCSERGFRLCFLLDEFDSVYQTFDKQTFAHLRAVRDANKNRLSYVLFMRSAPQALRDPLEVESFYELFSRSLIGLTPYTPADREAILQQLEARRRLSFAPQQRARMLTLCGGHIGLLQALLDTAAEQADHPERLDDLKWLSRQARIAEECRKLQEGLPTEEWLALIAIAKQEPAPPAALDMLRLKGLAQSQAGREEVFTPLLAHYACWAAQRIAQTLDVDPARHTVRVGARLIQDLSNLEFKLLEYLAQRPGGVARREEIMLAIYGDPGDSQDSRLDRLVNRIRQEIEPNPETPRYLLTVRGVGFRLNME